VFTADTAYYSGAIGLYKVPEFQRIKIRWNIFQHNYAIQKASVLEAEGSTVEFIGNLVQENYPAGMGVVSLDGSDSSLIYGNTFINNTINDPSFDEITLHVMDEFEVASKIVDNLFQNNEIAIVFHFDTFTLVDSNTFFNNQVAIKTTGGANPASPEIRYNEFNDNQTSIYVFRGDSVKILENIFTENTVAIKCDYVENWVEIKQNEFIIGEGDTGIIITGDPQKILLGQKPF
jgi:nitrous oxidase accessory protein NosD